MEEVISGWFSSCKEKKYVCPRQMNKWKENAKVKPTSSIPINRQKNQVNQKSVVDYSKSKLL